MLHNPGNQNMKNHTLEISLLKSKVVKYESQIENFKNKFKELLRIYSEKEAKLSQQSSQNSFSSSDPSSLMNQLNEYWAKINHLESEKSTLEESLKITKIRMEDYFNTSMQLKNSTRGLETEIQNLSQENQRKNHEIGQLKQMVQSLRFEVKKAIEVSVEKELQIKKLEHNQNPQQNAFTNPFEDNFLNQGGYKSILQPSRVLPAQVKSHGTQTEESLSSKDKEEKQQRIWEKGDHSILELEVDSFRRRYDALECEQSLLKQKLSELMTENSRLKQTKESQPHPNLGSEINEVKNPNQRVHDLNPFAGADIQDISMVLQSFTDAQDTSILGCFGDGGCAHEKRAKDLEARLKEARKAASAIDKPSLPTLKQGRMAALTSYEAQPLLSQAGTKPQSKPQPEFKVTEVPNESSIEHLHHISILQSKFIAVTHSQSLSFQIYKQIRNERISPSSTEDVKFKLNEIAANCYNTIYSH